MQHVYLYNVKTPGRLALVCALSMSACAHGEVIPARAGITQASDGNDSPPEFEDAGQTSATSFLKLGEPKGAAGFNFDESMSAVRSVCEENGFVWSESKGILDCSGTPIDIGLDAASRLQFCQNKLCRIELLIVPKENPYDSLSVRIGIILSALENKYGFPTTKDVTYGMQCAHSDLLDCLISGHAHFWYQWKWESGEFISLALGVRGGFLENQIVDRKSAALIHVRYGDERMPDSDPTKLTIHGI